MRCRHTPTQAASAIAASGTEKIAPRSSQTLTAKAAIRKAASVHSAAVLPFRRRMPSTIRARAGVT